MTVSSGAHQPVRARLALLLIRAGRRALLNTPVQRWRITETVHRRVVDGAWGRARIQVEFRGAQFLVPTKDATIVPGIIGGFYEKHELDLFEQLARASRRIVDVGGNIGVYALLGARALGSDGRLTAFEPVPENYELLQANLELNGLQDRVELVRAAVGDRNGSLTLHLAALSIGTHSASQHNASAGRGDVETMVVPMHTLDSFDSTSPDENPDAPVDLLKIDVEGYDGHVLRGAEELLRRVQPTLLVEFVPQHLRGCQFAPEEFVDRIFDTYRAVWSVTGASGRVSRTSREAVLKGTNANLVAATQPEHIAIIERWAAGT